MGLGCLDWIISVGWANTGQENTFHLNVPFMVCIPYTCNDNRNHPSQHFGVSTMPLPFLIIAGGSNYPLHGRNTISDVTFVIF